MTLLEFLRTAEPDAIALELFRMQCAAVMASKLSKPGEKMMFNASVLAATITALKKEHEKGLDEPQNQLMLLLARKMVKEHEREADGEGLEGRA